jgi:mercuric ion binding protein
MKKVVLKVTMVVAFVFAGNQSFANASYSSNKVVVASDSTVETFKVYGNCGMCKRTIEGSLTDVEGINSADWSSESKLMEVNFDKALISLSEIKQKISAVGYDTEEHRASEESYKGLHGCCQYERPEEIKNSK